MNKVHVTRKQKKGKKPHWFIFRVHIIIFIHLRFMRLRSYQECKKKKEHRKANKNKVRRAAISREILSILSKQLVNQEKSSCRTHLTIIQCVTCIRQAPKLKITNKLSQNYSVESEFKSKTIRLLIQHKIRQQGFNTIFLKK